MSGETASAREIDGIRPDLAAEFLRLTDELGQIQDVRLAMLVILGHGRELLRADSCFGALRTQHGSDAEWHAFSATDDKLAGVSDWIRRLCDGDPAHFQASNSLVLHPIDLGATEPPQEMDGGLALVLPVVHGGRVLGALIFTFVRQDELDMAMLPWAGVLGGTAAFAVENARLFDAAMRQAMELGAFYETAVAIGDERQRPPLLELVLDRASHLLRGKAGAVYLLDKDGASLKVVAVQGDTANELGDIVLFGEGVAGQVAESGHAVVLNDPPSQGEEGSARPCVRTLAVPMIWQQRLIGILEIVSGPSAAPYSDPDVRLARLVAYQAANALGVAQLIEAERSQRRIAEALEAAASAMNREIDLDEVLERILEQVMKAFSCDAANFQQTEGSLGRIVRAIGYEAFGLRPTDVTTSAYPPTRLRLLNESEIGKAVVVSDTALDAAWSERPGFEWLRSWAGIPIHYGEDLLGFIHLDSSQPNSFDIASGDRLAAFAAHAAVAISNARLFKRLAEEHQRLEQVYEIGRHMASSLNPREILDRLLGSCMEVLGAEHAKVELTETSGLLAGDRYAAQGISPMVKEEFYADELASLMETVTEGQMPSQVRLSVSGKTYWVLGSPLAAGGKMFGSMVIWVPGEGEAERTWLDMLAAIGQQAGLALTNAHQHAQVQRRLAELTLLQRVVGAIAQRLEVDAILGELTEQLHTILGFPAVQVYQRQEREVVLVKSSGPKPVIDRLAIDRGIVGRVARTGLSALVPDVRLDDDYVKSLVGTRAELAVPIRLGEEVMGVINVETSDPAQVDAGALELLGLVADQVSIALQNASLYEQVRDNVDTLEARVKERTAQLEKVVEQAWNAERAKAQFVADVSHELRTPLTNIGLYLDLLEIGAEDRYAEYMATLRRETDRLANLIEQMLAISSLDTNRVELNLRKTDVNSLLQVLVGDRSRMITMKGLNLEVDLADKLPEANADPQHLMQVMTNLLSNAVNYTPAGGVIRLQTKSQVWNGRRWVTFFVSDTGPGIPDNEKDRIFDRFFRGLVARAAGTPGTGLGLSISKEIVDRHNGRLTFTSQPGRGTTFAVWLPEFSGEDGADPASDEAS
jgi:signal transduction histidine kinase